MAPPRQEVIAELEGFSTGYSERLDTSANDMASGIAAVAVYLEGGGRKNIAEAYRIGSLIGLNTRIVDDILDGEEVDAVTDKQAFLNNYIDSIHGKDVSPEENESENIAYEAGRLLGRELDTEIVSGYMQDFVDIAVEEDKSSKEGYKSYSRGISASIGELVGMALTDLDDFEADADILNFAYDFAYLGQVADDKLDADTGLGDDIDEFYREAQERISRHGATGKFMEKASKVYPQLYRGMKALRK
ncbi:hypothetical protein ACK3SF_05625 [Candidatus Nanosalina sp. VS9-1]|uniref:hypothetical protein n=1 Tax=Candidatus Nanosalina sp. VS9-1 TaxID=3388566 RepID=UPI0039E01F1C